MHEKFERFQPVAAGAQTRFTKAQPATVNQRPLQSGNQPAGALAPFQKKVEADKKAASLDSETLAAKVRDGLAAFRPQLERWLPLVVELRSRFEALKKQKARTILGCRTWTQFCSEVLDYSDRHLRRLIEGANPAVKYRNRTKHRRKTKAFSVSAVAAHSGRDTDWSDNEYVKTCVDFVESALKPLESDPPRFHRVALAIAQAIAGDFLIDNGDDSALVEQVVAR